MLFSHRGTHFFLLIALPFLAISKSSYSQALNPGQIGTNQCIVSGTQPAIFTSVIDASGGFGGGAFNNYIWEKSIDGISYSLIPGSTASTYTEPSALSTVTYYRRRVHNPAPEVAFSNVIIISILSTATITGGPVAVCKNATPTPLTITASGGTAPYTFTYNISGVGNQVVSTTSGNSVNITALTSTVGTFTYTLVSVQESSVGSCINSSLSSFATVIVNPNPTFTPVVPPLPIICQGTLSFPVNYTTTNSPDKYTILWGATAVSAGFTNVVDALLPADPGPFNVSVPSSVAAGVYSGTLSVKITSTGCTSPFTSSSVLVNPLPTITGTLNVCAGSTTSLSGSGIAAASNPWVSSNTGVATVNSVGLVTGVASGTVTITYTNTNGCSQTALVTVNALPTISSISGTTSVCLNTTSLLNNATTGGTWSSNNTSVATVNTIGLVTGLVLGTATISYTVTNGNGCTQSSSVSVSILAVPAVPTISASGPTTFCSGGSVTLQSNSGTGNQWYKNGLLLSGVTNQNYTANTSGTYTVLVTNGSGCVSNTSNLGTIITVNALPTSTISAGGPTTFCSGGLVTLTASAGSSYAWSNGVTTSSISVNSSGNYFVTVTNANGCSRTSAATVVTVNALPTSTISAGGSTTFCAGGSVTLTASAGSFYAWSNGATTSSILANSIGNYTVTVTNASGCSSTSAATIITVNPLPTSIITAGGPTTFCTGGSVTLTAIAGSSYVWSNGATTSSIRVTSSGNYTVTISNANGCLSIASPTTITVNPLPSLSITNPAAVCSPGTVDLTSTAITAGSNTGLGYSYFTNAANTNILTAPSAVNTTGTYYIKGTVPATGCFVSQAVNVFINPQPVIVINAPTVVCAPAAIDLTASSVTSGSEAGLTFTRFTNAAATIPLTNDNAVAVSGTYYIKGSLASGCSAVLPVTVTINPPPSVVINSPAAVCAPGTIDLTQNNITLNSTAGLAYTRWTNAAATIQLLNANAVNISGIYFIKGTLLTTGCALVKPVTATINPLPNGIVQNPAVNYLCDGAHVLLTASNADQYQWYADQQIIPGATGINYTATKAATYTVQFISNQGCTAFASNTIRLDLLSKAVLAFTPDNRCIGTAITFTNNSMFAASGGISWLWDFGDGSFSNSISPAHIYTKPGTYTVSLTVNNAVCNNLTDSKTVTYIIEQPQQGITYTSVTALAGAQVVLQARVIGVQYLWQPNTGLSSANIQLPVATVSQDKTYTVSITSTAGCITTDTVQVKIIEGAEVYVPQGFSPNGDRQNDRLYPIMEGMKGLTYFKVFNRWGNLVFQVNDAIPANGWNGKFNGIDQPAGSYAWIAEAVDVNGNTIRRSGSVLLIR